jgi:hypothetical protein
MRLGALRVSLQLRVLKGAGKVHLIQISRVAHETVRTSGGPSVTFKGHMRVAPVPDTSEAVH